MVSKTGGTFKSRDHMTSWSRKEMDTEKHPKLYKKPPGELRGDEQVQWAQETSALGKATWSSFRRVSEVSGNKKVFKLTRLEITFCLQRAVLRAQSCPWRIPAPVSCGTWLQTWTTPSPHPLHSRVLAASSMHPSRHKSWTPSVPLANTCPCFTDSRLWREEAHSWLQWHKQALYSITCKIFKAFFTSFIQSKPVQPQDRCL